MVTYSAKTFKGFEVFKLLFPLVKICFAESHKIICIFSKQFVIRFQFSWICFSTGVFSVFFWKSSTQFYFVLFIRIRIRTRKCNTRKCLIVEFWFVGQFSKRVTNGFTSSNKNLSRGTFFSSSFSCIEVFALTLSPSDESNLKNSVLFEIQLHLCQKLG